MFTRNWYYAMAGIMANLAGSSIKKPVNVNGDKTYIAYAGDTSINLLGSIDYSPSMQRLVKSFTTGASGVAFGTGRTPPTTDDYTLSGDLVSGIVISAALSYEFQDDGMVYKSVYAITNNNANAITIGEVGLVACPYAYDLPVLVERTVLETPVTIEPGGIGKVTYTIRMNFPT